MRRRDGRRNARKVKAVQAGVVATVIKFPVDELLIAPRRRWLAWLMDAMVEETSGAPLPRARSVT